jgi:hypothetical protein
MSPSPFATTSCSIGNPNPESVPRPAAQNADPPSHYLPVSGYVNQSAAPPNGLQRNTGLAGLSSFIITVILITPLFHK